jgi:hypothetical protein
MIRISGLIQRAAWCGVRLWHDADDDPTDVPCSLLVSVSVGGRGGGGRQDAQRLGHLCSRRYVASGTAIAMNE